MSRSLKRGEDRLNFATISSNSRDTTAAAAGCSNGEGTPNTTRKPSPRNLLIIPPRLDAANHLCPKRVQGCDAFAGGFGSRMAAIKAVSDTNGSFNDHRGMRQWVRSDEVISLAARGNWPTPETASLGKSSAHMLENSQWSAIQFKSAVIWQKPPSPGSRVLIRASRHVESRDRTPLETLKEPMRFPHSGIFEARISTDCAMVEGKWIGPTPR